MEDNLQVKMVVELVKELFMKSINNQAELSKLIDKYLIPQESEKKQNAEVSTPRQLRQDMLDKIPTDFWKSPKLVFEPCCGKGGFLIDIIERFMVGLSDLITDDKERYKFIIENCLYFSDINECNIYICKLLIDPNNKYTLNYNLGDTLKLNIKHKWKINGFDAVIGNPPYNKNLYKKFTEYCLQNTKNLLLFVIPSNFTIGISHISFIDVLKNNGLKIVNYLNKSDWTTKIDIDTLYLLCIKNYKDSIYINNILINRDDKILNIKNIVHYNLLKKINTFNKMILLKGKNKTLNYSNKIETDNIKFTYSTDFPYKLLSRLNGGRGDEIYYTNKTIFDSNDDYKLIFPRGTGSYNSITNLKKISKDIVYSKITNENIYLSTGLVYFIYSTLEEAQFNQWYLMRSKFVRYMFIMENKYSELTKGFINLLPIIDVKSLKIIHNDEFVYNYLNLSKDEITMIESYF